MKKLLIVLALVIGMVTLTAGASIAGCYCGGCCWTSCCCSQVVMKPFVEKRVVTQLVPTTTCGPCGTVCTVMKEVKIVEKVTVMKPVQVFGCGCP